MGVLDEWLGDQLKSPLGQLIWLVLILALRLAHLSLSQRAKRKRSHPPNSPKKA